MLDLHSEMYIANLVPETESGTEIVFVVGTKIQFWSVPMGNI